MSNKPLKRFQKTKKPKHQDDDVTSEESDAELLVFMAVVSNSKCIHQCIDHSPTILLVVTEYFSCIIFYMSTVIY